MIERTTKLITQEDVLKAKSLGYGKTQDLNVETPTLLEDWGFRASANPKSNGAMVFHFRVKGKTYATTFNNIDDSLLVTTKEGKVTFSNKKVIILQGRIVEAVAELA
jgi:hypothetical protein